MDKNLIYDWLSLIPGATNDLKLELIRVFGGAEALVSSSAADIKTYFVENPDQKSPSAEFFEAWRKHDFSAAEKDLAKTAAYGASFLCYESDDYPEKLRLIADPPLVLHCKGNIELLYSPATAVVGTRRCSPYGRWAAHEIARRVAMCGITIVSGMAEGIDSSGHLAALECGGNTVAVLGTGIDVCFPRSNAKLFAGIKEKGLVVSEYSMGEGGAPWHFPQRNRIISGLSEKCIMVEGALRSGSLITAGYAAEQGKDLFAVPGNINQPNSIGANSLIMDGACPILSVEKVCETLGYSFRNLKNRHIKLSPIEQRIYEKIEQSGTVSFDELVLFSDLSAYECMRIISALELKDLIVCEGNRCRIS